jgi:serine/threonine protein kinase
MKLDARKQPDFFPVAVGSTIDGYLIESVLERRAGGELVCDAVDPDGFATTLEIALAPPPDRQAATRLRKLARLRAELRHPGLVPIEAVGEHAGRPYIACGRYPADTFADLLHRGPIEVGEVLSMLATACDALDRAHAAGLVHQRLTAESLLVDEQQLVLDGFGIAGGTTSSAIRAETILCMPPELLRGEPLGPAGNVYSLACLLVLALTGAPPFEGSPAAQALAHRMETPPQPSARRPELGPELDRVILRALSKHPAPRPASARELLNEAAQALGLVLPAPVEHPADAAHAAIRSSRKLRRRSIAAAWRGLPRPSISATWRELRRRSRATAWRAPRRRSIAASWRTRRSRSLAMLREELRRLTSAVFSGELRPGTSAMLAVIAVGFGLSAGTLVAPSAGDGGDPSARASFRAMLQRLDESRTDLRAQLASAETPAAQAEAADELAAAYRRVADGGGSRESELAARSAERAYLALAAAARSGDADRFATASREVERTERAAVTAVAPG